MLAEMAIGTESSRAMVWKSSWIKDSGKRNTYFASIAKALASHHAVSNANMAVQSAFNNLWLLVFPQKIYIDFLL